MLQFCFSLLDWCKLNGICRVVLLSSVTAAERVDSQLRGSPLRFLSNEDKVIFRSGSVLTRRGNPVKKTLVFKRFSLKFLDGLLPQFRFDCVIIMI